MVTGVIITAIFISVFVISISVWVTKKAYDVKNEIDDLKDNPHLSWQDKNKE